MVTFLEFISKSPGRLVDVKMAKALVATAVAPLHFRPLGIGSCCMGLLTPAVDLEKKHMGVYDNKDPEYRPPNSRIPLY